MTKTNDEISRLRGQVAALRDKLHSALQRMDDFRKERDYLIDYLEDIGKAAQEWKAAKDQGLPMDDVPDPYGEPETFWSNS